MQPLPVRTLAMAFATALVVTACGGTGPHPSGEAPRVAPTTRSDEGPRTPTGVVTLAFAGDMHFQLHLASLLDHPRPGLGPIRRALAGADVAMVNLESAITEGGVRDPKELETPGARYYYRASPGALDFLHAAGVDVVSMANNHGADYGASGLADSLRAARTSPVAVLGLGKNRRAAFTPYLTNVRGTKIAFLAADSSVREGASSVWAAGPATPGIAAARSPQPGALLAAVRAAKRQADVVVVYLHWGRESQACPTTNQQLTARAVAESGADVIVGSHAHVLLGSGWLGQTYVNYGLGNFLWYHNHQPDTGVLRLRIKDGEVVRDDWVPARIGLWGRPVGPRVLSATGAVANWRKLRGCAGLAARPGSSSGYFSAVRRIGPAVRARMDTSHRPGCPVPLRDLRHLLMSYVGFDGRDHLGEMVVAATHADSVTAVFRELYDARWPIRRMRLVDAYGGNDDRSMAANNTSAYNCRRVAGHPGWSAHAYGAAIDINPVQNPYVTSAATRPRDGRRFAVLDRSAGSLVPSGVIRDGDVVVRAFADIDWVWGGSWWAEPDYQHFAAPRARDGG